MQQHVTVRELGGEIWAAITEDSFRRRDSGNPSLLNTESLGIAIDLAMGVIARHVGHLIITDFDMPVVPLPNNARSDSE